MIIPREKAPTHLPKTHVGFFRQHSDAQIEQLVAQKTEIGEEKGNTTNYILLGGVGIAFASIATWLAFGDGEIPEEARELFTWKEPGSDDELKFIDGPEESLEERTVMQEKFENHDVENETEKNIDEYSEEKPDIHLLTEKEISDILFQSYRYSQGVPQLQGYLFKIVALENPEWRFPKDFDVDDFVDQHIDRFQKMTNGNAHSPQKNVQVDLETEVVVFRDVFSGKIQDEVNSPHYAAWRYMIGAELGYIENGRPRGDGVRVFDSFIVRYLVEGQIPPGPGGHVYRDVFLELEDFILKESYPESSDAKKLFNLLRGYEEKTGNVIDFSQTSPELRDLLLKYESEWRAPKK